MPIQQVRTITNTHRFKVGEVSVKPLRDYGGAEITTVRIFKHGISHGWLWLPKEEVEIIKVGEDIEYTAEVPVWKDPETTGDRELLSTTGTITEVRYGDKKWDIQKFIRGLENQRGGSKEIRG